MKIVLLGVGDASVANFITSIASFGSCAVAEHSTVDLAVLPSGEGDTLKRIALIRQAQAGNCFDEFKELSFQVNRANWSCELKLLPFPGAAFERHFVKVVHAIGKSSTAVQDSADSESADLALAGALDFIAAADAIILLLPKLPKSAGMDAPESPLRLVPTLLAAIRTQFELSGRAIALLPVLTHPEEQEPQDSENQRHENPTTATQRLRELVSRSLNRAVDVFECGVCAPDQAPSSNSPRANRPTPVSEVIARAVELPGALQLANMSARRSDRYSKLSNLIVSGRLSPPNESRARKSRRRLWTLPLMLIVALCAFYVLGVVVWRTAEPWIALSNIKAEFATDPDRTRLLELEVEHGSVGGIWRVILGTQWTECEALIHKCKRDHDSKLEDGLSSISTPPSIRIQLDDAESLDSKLTERTKLLLTDDAKIRNNDRLNENRKKLGSLKAHLPIEEKLDALLASQDSTMTPKQMASQVDSLSPTSFPLLKSRFEQVESTIQKMNEARLNKLKECLGTEKFCDDPNGTAKDRLAAADLRLIEIEAASDFCSGCPRAIDDLRAASKALKARIEPDRLFDLEKHELGAEPSIKALADFLREFGGCKGGKYPERETVINELCARKESLEQAKVTSLRSDFATDRLALNDELGWETYCRRAKERNEICVVALGQLDSKLHKDEVSKLITPENDIKNREFYGPLNDNLKRVDLLNTPEKRVLAAQQVLSKFSELEYPERKQELSQLAANVLNWQATVADKLKTDLSQASLLAPPPDEEPWRDTVARIDRRVLRINSSLEGLSIVDREIYEGLRTSDEAEKVCLESNAPFLDDLAQAQSQECALESRTVKLSKFIETYEGKIPQSLELRLDSQRKALAEARVALRDHLKQELQSGTLVDVPAGTLPERVSLAEGRCNVIRELLCSANWDQQNKEDLQKQVRASIAERDRLQLELLNHTLRTQPLADEHGDCTEIRLKHASQRLELIDAAEASWGKQSELLSELTKLRDEHREIQTQITHYGPFDDAYRDVAAKKNITAIANFLRGFGAGKYPDRQQFTAQLREDLDSLEQPKVTYLETRLKSDLLCTDPQLHWCGQVAREEARNVMCDELLTELSPESTFRERVKGFKTNDAADLNCSGPLQDELFKVNQLSEHDRIPAVRRLLGMFEASKYPKYKTELDVLAKNLKEWQASIATELKAGLDASDKPDGTQVELNWKQKVSLGRARELKLEAVLELLSDEDRSTYSKELAECKEEIARLSLEGPISDQLTRARSTERTLESRTVELSNFLVSHEGQISEKDNPIFTEARNALKEARTQLVEKLVADLDRETLKPDDTLPQSDSESRAEQRVGIVQQLIHAASWDEENRNDLTGRLELETKELMLAKKYGPIDRQIRVFNSPPSDLSADKLADKMKQLDFFLNGTESAEFPKQSTALETLQRELDDYCNKLETQLNTALTENGFDLLMSYSDRILRLDAQVSALNDAVIRIPPRSQTTLEKWNDMLAEAKKNLERAKVVKNVEDELKKVLAQDAAKDAHTPEEIKTRLRALNQAMGHVPNDTYRELWTLKTDVAYQLSKLEHQIIASAIQDSESHKDRESETWEKRFELAKKRRDRLAEAGALLVDGDSKVGSSLDDPLTQAKDCVKEFQQMRDAEADIAAALQSSNMNTVADAIHNYQGTPYTQIRATLNLKPRLMDLARDEVKKLKGELENWPHQKVVDSSSLEAVNETNKQREKLLKAARVKFPEQSSPADDLKEEVTKLMKSDQQWYKTQKDRHEFIAAAKACTLNENDLKNSIEKIDHALKLFADYKLESDPELKARADELKQKQMVWQLYLDWDDLTVNLEALKKNVAGGQEKPADAEKLEKLVMIFTKLKDDSSKTLPDSDRRRSKTYFDGYQNLIDEIRTELKPNTPAIGESN